MEAQFTVRDTLQNFANWVNAYGMTKQADFIPQTVWHLVTGRYLEHPVESKGLIRFTFDIAEPERLEVTAVTRIEFDTATKQWLTENDELNAYFAELVRAIRLKWEPISLTLARAQRKAHKQDDLAKVEVAVRLHDIERHTWAEAADCLCISERQLQRLRRKHRPDTIRHAQANVR
jgi:hypothetical protein